MLVHADFCHCGNIDGNKIGEARQSIHHGLSPTLRFPNSWQWKMLYYKARRYQRGFLNVSIPKPKLRARKHGLTTLRRAINEIGNWVIDRRTVTGEALASSSQIWAVTSVPNSPQS